MRYFLVLLLLLINLQVRARQATENTLQACLALEPTNPELQTCVYELMATLIDKHDYRQVNQLLEQDLIKTTLDGRMTDILGMLVCGSKGDGTGTSLPASERELFLKTINTLPHSRAAFDSMPGNQYVTNLFCVIARNDTELTDYILTLIDAGPKELDGCLYEGYATSYVPIYRAIELNNQDLANVLLEHGASLNYRILDTTPLIEAIRTQQLAMAEWLLDKNVSVHDTDTGLCDGKLPLAYAQELPAETEGRDPLILRIESLMQVFPKTCKKT